MSKLKFTSLTQYIAKLSPYLVTDKQVSIFDDTFDQSKAFETVNSFIGAIFDFCKVHPEYPTKDYLTFVPEELKKLGIDEYSWSKLTDRELENIGERLLVVLLCKFQRLEYWQNGSLFHYCKNGTIIRYLKRLEAIDWAKTGRRVKQIQLTTVGMMRPEKYTIDLDSGRADTTDIVLGSTISQQFSRAFSERIRQSLLRLHVENWQSEYATGRLQIMDGEQWKSKVIYEDGTETTSSGSNVYPLNFEDFRALFVEEPAVVDRPYDTNDVPLVWTDKFRSIILVRGQDYFKRGLVTDYAETVDGVVTAIVQGTGAYHVAVKFDGEFLQSASCDCPYAAEGHNCKHMAAVIYAYVARHHDNLEDLTSASDTLEAMVDNISDQQARRFLKQMVTNNDNFAATFKNFVTASERDINYDNDVRDIDEIFHDFLGRKGYVEGKQTLLFENELDLFFRNELRPLIATNHAETVIKLVNYTWLKLIKAMENGSDDDIIDLFYSCSEIWLAALKNADMRVKRNALDWFMTHCDTDEFLYEDIIQQIIFDEFDEPVLLKIKLDWTQVKLNAVQKQDTQLLARNSCAEKWAVYHLKVMKQLNATEHEVIQFCLKNMHYPKVRLVYVDQLVKNKNYNQAIVSLIEGKKANYNHDVLAMLSHRLATVYQLLGWQINYQNELKQLLVDYEVANLDDYRELKATYSEKEWATTRQQLFKELGPVASMPLFAEDGLDADLFEAVSSQDNVYALEQYENLLRPKYDQQLLRAYTDIIQTMAESSGSRRFYKKLVSILKRMQTYPHGDVVTQRIIEHWRNIYRRRSALIDELKQFD